MKLKLLSKVFEMTNDEKTKINQVVEFILLFYDKYWFTSLLLDLQPEFISGILNYRKINPSLSFKVLCSAYRHLWYLTPQLIILALTDKELEDSSRVGMASCITGRRG